MFRGCFCGPQPDVFLLGNFLTIPVPIPFTVYPQDGRAIITVQLVVPMPDLGAICVNHGWPIISMALAMQKPRPRTIWPDRGGSVLSV